MLYKWLLILLTTLLLAACSSQNSRAPVADISRPPAQYSGTHIVEKGETLYAISWRYGRDFRELAANNHIAPPYVIYPGQRIKLAKQSSPAKQVAHQPTKKWTTVNISPATTSASKQTTVSQAPLQGRGVWLWPAQVTLARGFSSQNNGLDIVAQEGTPVVATAGGEVVYSGSGLRGYGQLIIIKHDDRYLSAYAHNRLLLVKEGDTVKVGQKIAEMGSSGTDSVKLHFEIRQEGKPVDPLLFLAKK